MIANSIIPKGIQQEILRRITQAEEKHNVRVLYAVESGSRAWGFASPDSDYDVRFIYARPKDWYLSVDLEEKRDVIEYLIVDEIDISGWDVRKALQLYRRSNPALVEWLHSPIVYRDDHSFADKAKSLLNSVYSVEKGIYHYRSMAKTNYRGYLREPTAPLKKYFYVLRPLLSIIWLEKYRKPAPIEFDKLRSLIRNNEPVDVAITSLLARKKISGERKKEPAVPVLNEFIEAELSRLENFNESPRTEKRSMDALNDLFRSLLV